MEKLKTQLARQLPSHLKGGEPLATEAQVDAPTKQEASQTERVISDTHKAQLARAPKLRPEAATEVCKSSWAIAKAALNTSMESPAQKGQMQKAGSDGWTLVEREQRCTRAAMTPTTRMQQNHAGKGGAQIINVGKGGHWKNQRSSSELHKLKQQQPSTSAAIR